MRFNDAITGTVLVVFAAAEITYTRTFPSLHGQSYGPDLFPSLIGFALAACGVVLIVRGLLARRRAGNQLSDATESSVDEPVNNATQEATIASEITTVQWVDLSNIAKSKHARINALLILFFLLIYILFADWIGFAPLSFITIAFLLYRLGSSIVAACTIAVVATVIIQLLFARLLLVPLPAGLLQGLVW